MILKIELSESEGAYTYIQQRLEAN